MNNLTKLARKQLAMHEALRRLGFTPEQIFLAFYNGVDQGSRHVAEVFTELRVGELSFKANFRGEKRVEPDAYIKVWEREVEMWNGKITNADRLAIYQREFTADVLQFLADAIAAKGITVPNLNRGNA